MYETQQNLCTSYNRGGYFASVSGSAQTFTCTCPKARACTYTQTHTNPVFQRAQLPEQHRWRTATWRVDPDSPPRQTYYRYIQCMKHRKKTLTAYIRRHKHAHTEKEAIQGETSSWTVRTPEAESYSSSFGFTTRFFECVAGIWLIPQQDIWTCPISRR